jgi:hypothetical protein
MMTGRLYIDGKDVYTDFGIAVVESGYNELVAFPPLKTVKSNDWQEFDGIEADLSAPVLNTRDISIKFAVWGDNVKLGALADLLADKAYHTFHCRSIGRKYRLRLVSQPNLEWACRLGFATFRFADDFPLDGYTHLSPTSNITNYGDYAIDDKQLTDYGVRVLQGSLAEIDKSPDIKPNLLRNIGTQSGAAYDNARVTFKSKEVKINCLMRADNINEFWRNHDALLYDLVRPDERRLYVDARGVEYPCHYKSCQTQEFYADGKIWWKFTLTLVFTSYRLKGNRHALRLVSDTSLRLMGNGYFRLT